MTDTTTMPSEKTKVLFLAWGYSIHAKRRIQLFIDDPEFDVAVVSTYNYHFTGAKNYLLTDALDSGFSLCRFLLKGLKVITFHTTPSLLLDDIYKAIHDIRILKTAVREFKPDTVFLQTLLYPCYLSYFLPRSLPIMITFWNGDVLWWAKWNGIERILKKKIVTYGVRRAAAITVNSESAWNACKDYGIEADKIHLIRYPGIDLDRFRPLSKSESRRKLGIDADKVMLCPRGFGGYLNSDVIIEAAAAVVKNFPNVLFLFISDVGGRTEWEKHRKRAVALGIEKNLRWDGQVPWDAVPYYYNASDAMISISSNDSLPNCMLEAMACGLPVIMGDIPQIREWVEDSANGFLVVPRDASALSERIIKIITSTHEQMSKFAEYNISLVTRKVDSRVTCKKIKELTKRHAQRNSALDQNSIEP